MSETTTPVRNQIIADAKSLPDLIQKASVFDPTLAQALNAKEQVASKTPLGAALAGGIAWAAGHYGLGWSPEFDATVAGICIVVGGYLTHAIQAWFAKPLLAAPTPAALATPSNGASVP